MQDCKLKENKTFTYIIQIKKLYSFVVKSVKHILRSIVNFQNKINQLFVNEKIYKCVLNVASFNLKFWVLMKHN